MIKRGFIDKDKLLFARTESIYDEILPIITTSDLDHVTISEEEIVKPYLEKLKKQIEEYKIRQLSIAIGVKDLETGKEIALEYVLKLIDDLLSEGCEKE